MFSCDYVDRLLASKSEGVGLIVVQLVSEISNLCDHNPPTLQTDGQTDRRHAIPRPRKCTKSALRGKKRRVSYNLLISHQWKWYTIQTKIIMKDTIKTWYKLFFVDATQVHTNYNIQSAGVTLIRLFLVCSSRWLKPNLLWSSTILESEQE